MLQIEIEKLPSFVMGKEKGIELGRAGVREQTLLIAKQLLDMSIEKEKIVQITGLELSELDALDLH